MANLTTGTLSAARPILLPALLDSAGDWASPATVVAPEQPLQPICLAVGTGRALPGAACLLLEPGQGLAVTRLSACVDGRWQAHRHAASSLRLTASTGFEEAVFEVLTPRINTVAAEQILSSAGLVQLYQAVSEVQGWTPGRPDSRTVRQAGVDGSDDAAEQALTLFCALLGSLAGRLTLEAAAWGGVALGGSVVPALGDWFISSPFRSRFEAHAGTGQDLRGVPTWVMPGLASP